MSLDPLLLEVLVCPQDKGPLLWFEDEQIFYNPRLQRTYAVRDGIPDMLIEDSVTVDDAEHERLMSKARESAAAWTGGKDPGASASGGANAPGGTSA